MTTAVDQALAVYDDALRVLQWRRVVDAESQPDVGMVTGRVKGTVRV